MSLRLITFDLDDTLWDIVPTIVHADREVRRWLIDRVPNIEARLNEGVLAHFRQKILQQQPMLVHDLSRLRRLVYRNALLESGTTPAQAATLATEAFVLFMEKRHQVVYFEGALETLATLKEHFVLGALTNGNADTDRLGLGCYFSFSYKASDVGLGKPHPHMFERALQSAGVEPSEALHIGDHPEHDIFGASAVGMHTLHFRSCPERYENLEALATPTLTADTMQEVKEKVLGFAARIEASRDLQPG